MTPLLGVWWMCEEKKKKTPERAQRNCSFGLFFPAQRGKGKKGLEEGKKEKGKRSFALY